MLARANPAVIATVRPDGHPVSVATWYLLDGDEIVVNMAASRRRLAHLRADPRVALTVLDARTWNSHVSIVGRVTALIDDPNFAGIDRQSLQYNGHPYQNHRDRGWTRASASTPGMPGATSPSRSAEQSDHRPRTGQRGSYVACAAPRTGR